MRTNFREGHILFSGARKQTGGFFSRRKLKGGLGSLRKF